MACQILAVKNEFDMSPNLVLVEQLRDMSLGNFAMLFGVYILACVHAHIVPACPELAVQLPLIRRTGLSLVHAYLNLFPKLCCFFFPFMFHRLLHEVFIIHVTCTKALYISDHICKKELLCTFLSFEKTKNSCHAMPYLQSEN